MRFRIDRFFLFITAHLLIFSFMDVLLSWHFFLKKKTTISEPVVKIHNIGNIYGSDITTEQKNEIENTILSESPFSDVDWNADHVALLMEKKFLFPDSIRGTKIQLIVPTQIYSPEEISDLIKSAYSSTLNNDFKVVVNNAVKLPLGMDIKIKVDEQKFPGSKVALVLQTPSSSEPKSLKIPYVLLKNYTMIVATETLEPGHRLTPYNIKKTSIWMDHVVDSLFQEIPIGFISVKKIEKGTLIWPSDALKKMDVNVGNYLTIEYSEKNLIIQSTVRAAESGSIGQIIKLRTMQNKLIFGEIMSTSKANFRHSNI